MTEADKDALLVRAALDIMTMQSRVAKLKEELRVAYKMCAAMQKATKRVAGSGEGMNLEGAVKLHILSTYHDCEKDIALTAKRLGVSRPTVYKYLPDSEARERKEMSRHRVVNI